MKCKALKAFADKYDNSIIFAVGDVLDFDEARAQAAAAYGLVEIIKSEPVAKAKTTAKKPQAKK